MRSAGECSIPLAQLLLDKRMLEHRLTERFACSALRPVSHELRDLSSGRAQSVSLLGRPMWMLRSSR
jgi:hypothetical protein